MTQKKLSLVLSAVSKRQLHLAVACDFISCMADCRFVVFRALSLSPPVECALRVITEKDSSLSVDLSAALQDFFSIIFIVS